MNHPAEEAIARDDARAFAEAVKDMPLDGTVAAYCLAVDRNCVEIVKAMPADLVGASGFAVLYRGRVAPCAVADALADVAKAAVDFACTDVRPVRGLGPSFRFVAGTERAVEAMVYRARPLSLLKDFVSARMAEIIQRDSLVDINELLELCDEFRVTVPTNILYRAYDRLAPLCVRALLDSSCLEPNAPMLGRFTLMKSVVEKRHLFQANSLRRERLFMVLSETYCHHKTNLLPVDLTLALRTGIPYVVDVVGRLALRRGIYDPDALTHTILHASPVLLPLVQALTKPPNELQLETQFAGAPEHLVPTDLEPRTEAADLLTSSAGGQTSPSSGSGGGDSESSDSDDDDEIPRGPNSAATPTRPGKRSRSQSQTS